jgi:hypothetical protein
VRRVLGIVIGALMLFFLVVTVYDQVVLDLRHETTEASVEGVTESKWIDGVDVVFRTRAGRPVRTSLDQVWIFDRPDVQHVVVVEYDPMKPTRARVVGSHTFAASVVLFGGGLAVVVTSAVQDSRRRRRRKD